MMMTMPKKMPKKRNDDSISRWLSIFRVEHCNCFTSSAYHRGVTDIGTVVKKSGHFSQTQVSKCRSHTQSSVPSNRQTVLNLFWRWQNTMTKSQDEEKCTRQPILHPSLRWLHHKEGHVNQRLRHGKVNHTTLNIEVTYRLISSFSFFSKSRQL